MSTEPVTEPFPRVTWGLGIFVAFRIGWRFAVFLDSV